MAILGDLENELDKIKERNKKVEADKAWETSWTRKIVIALLTYILISTFLMVAGFPNPWISSIVPAIGFVLSTLSVGIFKNFWIKYIYMK